MIACQPRARIKSNIWRPMFLIYTSMVTYITSYKGINTKLIGWVISPPAREDPDSRVLTRKSRVSSRSVGHMEPHYLAV